MGSGVPITCKGGRPVPNNLEVAGSDSCVLTGDYVGRMLGSCFPKGEMMSLCRSSVPVISQQ